MAIPSRVVGVTHSPPREGFYFTYYKVVYNYTDPLQNEQTYALITLWKTFYNLWKTSIDTTNP